MTTSESTLPQGLPPHPEPRRPAFALPAGATDCHTHVFDARHALASSATYQAADAGVNQMRAIHRALGIERAVVVHPFIYADSRATLDATSELGTQARAVVALGDRWTDATLEELAHRSVSGIRLHLRGGAAPEADRSALQRVAAAVAARDWHLELSIDASTLLAAGPVLRDIGAPVVIPHFAFIPATAGVRHPAFALLADWLDDGTLWLKLSAPNRVSATNLPPWSDVVPMAQTLIAVNDQRLVWGSDWPHPNRYEPQPNDADFIDQLLLWAPHKQTRTRILVDNPAVLYGFAADEQP